MAFIVTFYDQHMEPVRTDTVDLENVYHLIVPSSTPGRLLFYYSVDIDASGIEVPEPEQAGHA
jgi:hypothetical protein